MSLRTDSRYSAMLENDWDGESVFEMLAIVGKNPRGAPHDRCWQGINCEEPDLERLVAVARNTRILIYDQYDGDTGRLIAVWMRRFELRSRIHAEQHLALRIDAELFAQLTTK